MVKIVEVQSEIYDLGKAEDICTHIEKCGRTCYKSENLITDSTAVPFISGILKSGHESVIEHANVIYSMPLCDKNKEIFSLRDIRGLTVNVEKHPVSGEEVIVVSGNIRALRDLARQRDVHDFLLLLGLDIFYIAPNGRRVFEGVKIEGIQKSPFSELHNYVTTHSICDIGAYKDVTRHRFASFSIESTRYCNYSKGKFGSELTMIEPCNIEKGSALYAQWLETMEMIEKSYMKMAELGAKGDQLRMILPHSCKADMIMTASVAAWKHIFALRCHSAAHPSVRLVMKKALANIYKLYPDFVEKLYQEFISA
ncbi:MAG: FAD-dependent thymidylate synthase [Alphaproteobacteria bacterium]|nr:FAD-dependent thymidylate synthase [Alphaproteobacteria bacterium]